MTPRWLMFRLFAVAMIPLALPAILSAFTTLPPQAATALHWGGLGMNGAIMLVAFIDLLVTPSLTRVEVQRETSDAMSVGARNAVKIWLTNRNFSHVQLEFHDEPPMPCSTDGLPFELTLTPKRARYRVYHVTPQHRGPNAFGSVYLRSRSRLWLWQYHDQRPLPLPVKVFPDIQAVHGVELLARRNRMADAGVKLSRLRGRGSEFDRLRDYRRGDEFRHIDWKASAKHEKLISREFVVERNQNILIVLDCGRSMCNTVDGISHLDRSLNAAIMLAYIALRQHDNVGLLAFSNKVERWVRPMRGAGAIQTMIKNVYDIEPRYEASDYSLMVSELSRRFRKRSLVVLLTHCMDDQHLSAVSRQMRELRSTHLVLGAFLKNVPLVERVNSVPQTDVAAFQIAAAASMISTQTRQLANLQRNNGLLILDVLPEQLSADLVSQYLEIKARHLL